MIVMNYKKLSEELGRGFPLLSHLPVFDINEEEYKRNKKESIQQHPEESNEEIELRAVFRTLTRDKAPNVISAPIPSVKFTHMMAITAVSHIRFILIWLAILLVLLLLGTGKLHAQNTNTAIVVTSCGTPPANVYVAGQRGPQTVDINGNTCTPTGSGGTASNFGNASPAAGTAAGARDTSGNMQPLQLDGTGVGNNLDVNCKVGCTQAGDTVGTPVTLNVVSGAASVALAGENGAIVTFAPGTLAGTTIVPEISLDGGATYVSSLLHGPIFIDQSTFLVLTSLNNPSAISQFIAWNGPATNVRVRVTVYGSGSVQATLRAVTNRPYQLMQGTDTNGIPRFIMADSSGNMQVGVATALPSGSNTIGAFTQAGGPWTINGNVASGGTDSGNPTKTGGVFNTTQPTVTNGQRVDTQSTNRGGLIVATGVDPLNARLNDNSGNGITSTGNALDINIKSGGATGLTQGSVTSGQLGTLIQGAATTSSPIYTSGQTYPLSLDTAGSLRVNIIQGAANGVAQASTTSGQLGPLVQGAVTASPQVYTNGQTFPLSLDTAGSLRVNAGTSGNSASSATGSPVPANAGYQGINVGGTLRGVTGVNPSGTVYAPQTDLASVAGTSIITGGVNGSQGVGGLAGSGTALAGNPVLIGAANGANAQTLQTDGNQNLKVVAPLITYLTTPPFLSNNATHDFMLDEASSLKVAPGVVQQTLAVWNSGTGGGATQNIFTSDGPQSVVVQLQQSSGNFAAGAITFDVTYDGTNWTNGLAADQVLDPTSATLAQVGIPYTLITNTNKPFLLLPHGAQGLRIRLSTAITGTGTVTPVYELQYVHPASEVMAFSPVGTSFHVNCDAGCSSSPAPADNSGFTAGTSSATPISGFYHAAVDTVTNNSIAAVGINQYRAVRTVIEDNSKNAIGSGGSGNSLNVFIAGSNATVNTNTNQVNGSGVATAATGVQKVGIVGNTGAAMDAAGQNVAAPANELLIAGEFNTTPTTVSSGNVSPLQIDSGAALLVHLVTGGATVGAVTQASGPWTFNLTQALNTTLSVNNGTSNAGNIRVNIASDNSPFETIPVTTATTTDTALRCNILSAASTNSTNCKNAAGNVYGFRVFNTTTTVYYLRTYNLTTAPTCSSATGFVESFPIPPAGASGQVGGFVAPTSNGEGYTTGIGYCITGGSGSTDNTNAAVGIFGDVLYK